LPIDDRIIERTKPAIAGRSDVLGDRNSIERRIGRWLGRYAGAETMVDVTVIRDARGRATGLEIRPKEARLEWALMAHGAYLLRTNCP
jgi:hypothetical protein